MAEEFNFSGAKFELIENQAGHAADTTLMVFKQSSSPFSATYTGPNVQLGQVIVSGENMLYHAVDKAGQLSAGQAKIEMGENEEGSQTMTLDWQWLTGDQSGGISRWRRV